MHRILEAFRIINKAYRGYRKEIAVLSFFGLAGALFEGIGVTSLIPMFALLTGGGKLGDDLVSKIVIKVFSMSSFSPTIETMAVFISCLFIFKFFVAILTHFVTVRIDTRYYEEVSGDLFKKMADSSWGHLAKEKIGHLQNLLSINTGYSRMLLRQVSAVLVMAMNIFSYIFLAFNISLIITLITLVLAVVVLSLYWPSVSKIKADSSFINKYNSEISHYVNENVAGMKMIKVMGAVEQVKVKILEYFKNLRALRFKVLLRKKIVGELLEPVVLVYVMIIFFLFYKRPDFNIAAFAVIFFLIQRIFSYVNQMQGAMHAIAETLPYLKSILEYNDEAKQGKEVDSGKSEFHFDKALEFKCVRFSYKKNEDVLSGINLAIGRGEIVGLVGPSGAGKTTVADLILRLSSPTSGYISVDNEDISSISLREWRRNIGYVPQDIFLINDTIAANVRFFNDKMSDEEIIEAAKMANIYDFIQSKPQGLETMVGERGVSLSAGQRQRIVLARVLARKPALLILDEATSALDNESELAIQGVIHDLKGRMTVLIIAHRLTTVLNCGNIFVLQNGKMIENGNPQQLLSNPRSYFSRTFNINR